MKFSRASADSCIWEGITPRHSAELTDWGQFSSRGLGGPVDSKLNINQQHALAQKKANSGQEIEGRDYPPLFNTD